MRKLYIIYFFFLFLFSLLLFWFKISFIYLILQSHATINVSAQASLVGLYIRWPDLLSSQSSEIFKHTQLWLPGLQSRSVTTKRHDTVSSTFWFKAHERTLWHLCAQMSFFFSSESWPFWQCKGNHWAGCIHVDNFYYRIIN